MFGDLNAILRLAGCRFDGFVVFSLVCVCCFGVWRFWLRGVVWIEVCSCVWFLEFGMVFFVVVLIGFVF